MGLDTLLATASTTGIGGSVALGLLVPMEAGLPIPPPADLVMFAVGERAAAGALPLWLAVLGLEAVAVIGTSALFFACRGPGHALVTRLGPRIGLTEERLTRSSQFLEEHGRPALAVGRGTPGLRTVTVVAAGGSGISAWQALPALVVGSSAFLQLHLVLGLFLGPVARKAFDAAKGPAVLGLVVLLGGAVLFWLVRRGRRGGAQALAEAACPACLALGRVAELHPGLAALSSRPDARPTG